MSSDAPDLSHLHPAARATALLPIEQRLQHARADRWIGYTRATDALRRLQVLVIDELHNILAGNTARRREFLNLLRYLGNRLRIPIVGVGTHDAYLAIRSDDQLENRFEPLVLPRWQPDEQSRSLLASFAASFRLHRRSPIVTPEMAAYLIERSEGTIGELTALLTAAATVAITSGEEAITADTLEAADYRGPSERRRIFERAMH